MIERFRLPALICTAAMLAACSSPLRPQQSFVPAVAPAGVARSPSAAGSGTLLVRVKVPDQRTRPDYIGPSTARISIAITGPTNFKKTASLKLGATGCKSKVMTLECTLNIPGLKACPSKKPCYTGSVSTFDAAKHVLSSDQKFKFTIGSGPTLIPLVLYGIPKSIAFMPSVSSILTGTQSSGFIEPKCSASPQTVSLLSADADGNFIVGVGSPKLTLTSGDVSQLSVAGGSKPETFVLSPPAAPGYAFGNQTIALTATATAPKQSGAPLASTHVNVTYSGDICGVITEFDVPSGTSSGPFGITRGPDGALWFAETTANKIGRITTAGSFSEYPIPTASAETIVVTAGLDGNVWFTEQSTSKIGKITPGGAFTEIPTTTPNAEPVGITAGPDGNMWFVEAASAANNVASISTSGTIHEYALLTPSALAQTIVAGPDGALWFTEDQANKIGRVTTAGSVTETAIPTASSQAEGITLGSDGKLWFAEAAGNKIGRAQPTLTGIAINSEFPLPEAGAGTLLITTGPDGNVWLAEVAGNRIGSISPSGAFAEYSVPTTSSEPADVATGPDGAIWFTEAAAGKIGRLR
ncbi:MAG: hypothetical protein JOY98_07140 [Candidatus Eremiobacteraeota bacterium]|nr:hypothetical protein [Candidatus Eremiobacteraeota bacterium]